VDLGLNSCRIDRPTDTLDDYVPQRLNMPRLAVDARASRAA